MYKDLAKPIKNLEPSNVKTVLRRNHVKKDLDICIKKKNPKLFSVETTISMHFVLNPIVPTSPQIKSSLYIGNTSSMKIVLVQL
jgi:hypothetical protein